MVKKIDFNDTQTAFAYKSTGELRKADFLFTVIRHPAASSFATALLKMALALRLPVDPAVRATVFSQFCGGETIEEADAVIKKLYKNQVKTILDFSAEGSKDEKSFDETALEIEKIIAHAAARKEIPFAVLKPSGIASFDILAKLHVGEALTENENVRWENARRRMENICACAHRCDIPVLIDAEHSWIQKPTDECVVSMMKKFNREKAIVFNTYQLYLADKLEGLKEAHRQAKQDGYWLGAKIVRGAYMEIEKARAEKSGYKNPVCSSKEATDKNYNSALDYCIENIHSISLISCTHNEESNRHLINLSPHISSDDPRLWFAQLLGMSDHISFNLAKAGFNVAKYVPYGKIKEVMPYLIRRANENTSAAGQAPRELTLIRKELKRRSAPMKNK